jgi:hypothetical protein
MFAFLEDHYNRGPLEGVGFLLSNLALTPSGHSADPAMLDDWKAAVDRALSGEVDVRRRSAKGESF